jgi:hypothetical protein
MFRRHLRMTHDSYMRLLDKIRPHLPNMNEKKGDSRGGFIIPELRLYVAIRYLAGGSYSDILLFLLYFQDSILRMSVAGHPCHKQGNCCEVSIVT